MKIFCSVFGISTALFFLFLLPVVCSWISYLSSTIHKNFMFLLCNGLLVFIRLNSHSICRFPTGKRKGEEKTATTGDEQLQVAESFESRPSDGSKTVAQVEDEKEAENRIMIEEDEEKEVDQTFSPIDDDLGEVAEDCETLSVIEETPYYELELETVEQAEEGGTDMISLEELNKKCEEFIRKIREEMRYESQITVCY